MKIAFSPANRQGTPYMAPNFDNVFGIHETALRYRGARASVLAANIANAETPGYRARDLRFDDVMRSVKAGSGASNAAAAANAGATLNAHAAYPGHLNMQGGFSLTALAHYREPLQASLDQNTVDAAEESARFAENAMRYQASLRFLNGRISGLIKALKGE